MKRKKKYSVFSVLRKTAALLTVVLLAVFAALPSGPVSSVLASEESTAVMPDLDPAAQYSLSIIMRYTETSGSGTGTQTQKPVSDVQVKAAQVASLAVNNGSADYTFLDKYQSSGITFAGMTASQQETAAQTLRGLVSDSDASVAVTGSDGAANFSGLAPGIYLVWQDDDANSAYGLSAITPMLAAVPYPQQNSDGTWSWLNQVTMYPKTEPSSPDRAGSVTVTKSLFESGSDRMIVPGDGAEFVFYVGLFTDEACTQRVSGTGDLPLRFSGSGQTSATFSNLPVGYTYYIAETDGAGNVVSSVNKDGVVFTAAYEEGQAVSVTAQQRDASIRFKNYTPKLPPKYYYSGTITVTKNMVAADGSEYKSDDVWYAGIFSDEKYTDRIGDVIELSMDGKSSVSVEFSVSIGEKVTDSVTYYITETDADGVPLANDGSLGFTYTLSKEGGKVELNAKQNEDSIVITNRFGGQETPTPSPSAAPSITPTPMPSATPSPVPSESLSSTPTPTPGGDITTTPVPGGDTSVTPSPGGGTSTPKPTKTGDTTPLGFWLVTAAAALTAAGCGLLIVKKKDRR